MVQTHHKLTSLTNDSKTAQDKTAQNKTESKHSTNFPRQMHPAIALLADTIRSVWHRQLMLFPYQIPTDLGYVKGTLEGERLTIQNLCYQTFQFRKLHLELAQVGNNLDILHCVMFPHPCFNLPIFGVDIVAARGNITAAIVDLSPVSGSVSGPVSSADTSNTDHNRSLPKPYIKGLGELLPYPFEHPRDLPEWGSIFSEHCLFVRPTSPTEENGFLTQVTQYLLLHCQLACESTMIQDKAQRAAILAGQQHYCAQQRKNDKTRRILERAFDPEWAQRYLETMLFDCVEQA